LFKKNNFFDLIISFTTSSYPNFWNVAYRRFITFVKY